MKLAKGRVCRTNRTLNGWLDWEKSGELRFNHDVLRGYLGIRSKSSSSGDRGTPQLRSQCHAPTLRGPKEPSEISVCMPHLGWNILGYLKSTSVEQTVGAVDLTSSSPGSNMKPRKGRSIPNLILSYSSTLDEPVCRSCNR